MKKENQVKPIKTAGRKQHKLAYKAWVEFIIMAARLFFFRRDICPRPECALLDNLPIVSFSLSERTVSQKIDFFICFRGHTRAAYVRTRPYNRFQGQIGRIIRKLTILISEKIWRRV